MKIIRKKIWPQWFNLVKSGRKKFEIRVADFKIKPDDTLVLKEWDPQTKKYTGRSMQRKVKYVIKFKLDDYGQRKIIEKKGLYVIEV